MAPTPTGEGNSTTEVPQTTREPIWTQSRKPRKQARGAKQHKIDGIPLLARTLEEYNIDNKTLQFFKFSWRPSTRKNYVTHISRWAKINQLGKPLDSLQVYVFKENRALCVVRALKRYLARTRPVRRKHTQLLISYIGLHEPISRAMLTRWTLVSCNWQA